MIEVGMKVVGNWSAGWSYSYGKVVEVNNNVVVDFDDFPGYTYYPLNHDFKNAKFIREIGVYIDYEGMVY